MANNEKPIYEGPLDNPAWTEEQNRRFDTLDESGFPMAEARRAALRLASSKPSETRGSQKSSVGSESAGRGKKTADGPPEHVAAELRVPQFEPIKETEEDRSAREKATRDFLPPAA